MILLEELRTDLLECNLSNESIQCYYPLFTCPYWLIKEQRLAYGLKKLLIIANDAGKTE